MEFRDIAVTIYCEQCFFLGKSGRRFKLLKVMSNDDVILGKMVFVGDLARTLYPWAKHSM